MRLVLLGFAFRARLRGRTRQLSLDLQFLGINGVAIFNFKILDPFASMMVEFLP